MPTTQSTYSANNGLSGIWRAVIIQDNGDGRAYVYIPALHKQRNPFATGVFNKADYPLANTCSWQVRPGFMSGDPVFVMFENGNGLYPVIVGQLGTTLKVGDLTKADVKINLDSGEVDDKAASREIGRAHV